VRGAVSGTVRRTSEFGENRGQSEFRENRKRRSVWRGELSEYKINARYSAVKADRCAIEAVAGKMLQTLNSAHFGGEIPLELYEKCMHTDYTYHLYDKNDTFIYNKIPESSR